MMRKPQPRLSEAVRAVLDERGLSVRNAAIRTGIDRLTLANMLDGVAPRLEIVEEFARTFSLDVNEWRLLAGYEAIRETDPDRLVDGLAAAEPDRLTGALIRGLQEYPQLRQTIDRAFGDEDADP